LEPCYAFVIPRKVPQSISPVEINGEKNMKWKKLLIQGYGILHSLARLQCE
jgi:hypothetical protein